MTVLFFIFSTEKHMKEALIEPEPFQVSPSCLKCFIYSEFSGIHEGEI